MTPKSHAERSIREPHIARRVAHPKIKYCMSIVNTLINAKKDMLYSSDEDVWDVVSVCCEPNDILK